MPIRGTVARASAGVLAVLALVLIVVASYATLPPTRQQPRAVTAPADVASPPTGAPSVDPTPTDSPQPDPTEEPSDPPADPPPCDGEDRTEAPAPEAPLIVLAACKDDFAEVTHKPPKDNKVAVTIGINKKLDPDGFCSIEDVVVVKPKGLKPDKNNTVEIPYDPKDKETVAEITFTVRCKAVVDGLPDFVYRRVSTITITPAAKEPVKIETKVAPPK